MNQPNAYNGVFVVLMRSAEMSVQGAEITSQSETPKPPIDVNQLEGGPAIELESRQAPAIQVDELVVPDTEVASTSSESERRSRVSVLEQAQPGEVVGATTFRPEPDSDIVFVTRGRVFTGGETADGGKVVHAPDGARGKEIDPANLEDKLRDLFPRWVPVEARFSPAAKTARDDRPELPPGEESDSGLVVVKFLPVHDRWAADVEARRATDEQLDGIYRTARAAQREIETITRNNPRNAAENDRLQSLMDEITDARREGAAYFMSQFLVGGATSDKAVTFARLVAQTLQSIHPRYRFTHGEPYSREDALLLSPQPVSTETVAIQTDQIPERIEIPGLNRFEEPHFAVNHQMRKLYPDEPCANMGRRESQRVLGMPVEVPENVIRGNVLVTGESGSGKSERVIALLLDFADTATITTFDPRVTKYAEELSCRLAAREDIPPERREVVAMRLVSATADSADAENAPPLHVDIFKPYPGYSYARHAEDIVDIVENATTGKISVQGADNAYVASLVRRFLSGALTGATYVKADGSERRIKGLYERSGIDLELDQPINPEGDPAKIKISDLFMVMDEMIEAEDYAKDVKQNVKAIVFSRMRETFEGISGELFREGQGYEIDFEKTFSKHSVWSLDGYGETTRDFMMGLLYKMQQQHTAVRGLSERVEQICVLEEMQDFVKPGSKLAQAIGESFRADRKKGAVWVGVSQNPSLLPAEIAGNAAFQMACRVTLGEDAAKIREAMGLTAAQVRKLGKLDPGQAYIRGRGIPEVMQVRQESLESVSRDLEAGPHPTSSVVKLGVDEKAYDRETVIKAGRLLEKAPIGKAVRGWAELALFTHGLGFGDILPKSQSKEAKEAYAKAEAVADGKTLEDANKMVQKATFKDDLFVRLQRLPEDIRHRLINQAVTEAVGLRTGLKNNPLTQELAARLRAIADGKDISSIPTTTRGVLYPEQGVLNFEFFRDALFPPSSRGPRPIDRALGATFNTEIAEGRGDIWMKKLEDLCALFDFTDEAGKSVVLDAFASLRDHAEVTLTGRENQGEDSGAALKLAPRASDRETQATGALAAMRALAEEAGVDKQAIINYFKSGEGKD